MSHQREKWNYTCIFPLDAHIHSAWCVEYWHFHPFPSLCVSVFVAVGSWYLHPQRSEQLSNFWRGGYNQTRICVPIISGLGVSTQCCTGSRCGVLTKKPAHLCSKRCRSWWNRADLHIVRLNLSGEDGWVLCHWRRPEAITRDTFDLSMDGCTTTIVHEMQFLD